MKKLLFVFTYLAIVASRQVWGQGMQGWEDILAYTQGLDLAETRSIKLPIEMHELAAR